MPPSKGVFQPPADIRFTISRERVMSPPNSLSPPDPADPLGQANLAHPFLAGLKPKFLSALRENAMTTRYPAGQTIFRQGEPANRFYLVHHGRVALESIRPDRTIALIQEIGPGDVLGWSWLFPPYYWHFDARALDTVEATFFYGTRLREHCEEDHELGYELLRRISGIVIQRLQAARSQLLAARF